jgi:hypothetical protein
MNFSPTLADSVVPLLIRDPSEPKVMYKPLLTAFIEETPAGAPTFGRMTYCSHAWATERMAAKVKFPATQIRKE